VKRILVTLLFISALLAPLGSRAAAANVTGSDPASNSFQTRARGCRSPGFSEAAGAEIINRILPNGLEVIVFRIMRCRWSQSSWE